MMVNPSFFGCDPGKYVDVQISLLDLSKVIGILYVMGSHLRVLS